MYDKIDTEFEKHFSDMKFLDGETFAIDADNHLNHGRSFEHYHKVMGSEFGWQRNGFNKITGIDLKRAPSGYVTDVHLRFQGEDGVNEKRISLDLDNSHCSYKIISDYMLIVKEEFRGNVYLDLFLVKN